jgi:hypothetical protein
MRGEFQFREGYVYKMPVHFSGFPFYPVRVTHGDMTAMLIEFETDESALARFIPEDFELLRPAVTVQFANFRDVEWMSNGEYRLIQASAPVRYEGNSEGLEGVYPPGHLGEQGLPDPGRPRGRRHAEGLRRRCFRAPCGRPLVFRRRV